jgi:hypothetical protein
MKTREYNQTIRKMFFAINESRTMSERQKQALIKAVAVQLLPIHPTYSRIRAKRIAARQRG